MKAKLSSTLRKVELQRKDYCNMEQEEDTSSTSDHAGKYIMSSTMNFDHQ